MCTNNDLLGTTDRQAASEPVAVVESVAKLTEEVAVAEGVHMSAFAEGVHMSAFAEREGPKVAEIAVTVAGIILGEEVEQLEVESSKEGVVGLLAVEDSQLEERGFHRRAAVELHHIPVLEVDTIAVRIQITARGVEPKTR